MSDKYFCRNCKGLRKQTILFRKEQRSSHDEEIQYIDKYLVIECNGCEAISFLSEYGDETMVNNDHEGNLEYYDEAKIFPPYLERGTELTHKYYLPENIREIYSETIICFKSGAYVLTAGGFRAIIEAICNNLKIKKASLSIRIDILFEKGILTEKESKRLHSIRFVGNDALHEIETPNANQLNIVLDIINHILENLYIQDQKIKNGLDVIIDNYTEFTVLIGNKITSELIGQQITIEKLLGKSIRLIKDKKTLEQFETNLKAEIKVGKFNLLTIENEQKNTLYKVIRRSDFLFGL